LLLPLVCYDISVGTITKDSYYRFYHLDNKDVDDREELKGKRWVANALASGKTPGYMKVLATTLTSENFLSHVDIDADFILMDFITHFGESQVFICMELTICF
jgi:hypothetical protein